MNALMDHIGELHTTGLGALRIERNLGLGSGEAVACCRRIVAAHGEAAVRRGKNWYVEGDGCRITIHAHSYTIITAHRLNAPA